MSYLYRESIRHGRKKYVYLQRSAHDHEHHARIRPEIQPEQLYKQLMGVCRAFNVCVCVCVSVCLCESMCVRDVWVHIGSVKIRFALAHLSTRTECVNPEFKRTVQSIR